MSTYRKPSQEELRQRLSHVEYWVTQESGTEPPFRNAFWDHFEPGVYVDITTGEPLFLSTDKFASSCGWPAFSKPLEQGTVTEHGDRSHFMRRTEVRSGAGEAHLGHVFDDGPPELGGLRYCINSAALRFVPKDDMERKGYAELLPLLD